MSVRISKRRAVLAAVLAAVCSGSAMSASLPPAAAASSLYVDHLIIKFAPGAVDRHPLQRFSAESGLSLQREKVLAIGAELHALGRTVSLAEARRLAANVARMPGVEYAEPDQILQADLTPNDPLYSSRPQWHYFEAVGGIDAPAAWDLSTGSGVVVAVLDTGYRPHVDLVANIVPGYDFISSASVANDGNGRDPDATDPGDWTSSENSSWHGTHTAGTIAAVTNNGVGVAGVAFNAKVMPVRVLGKGGGSTSDIADAIVWASGGSVPGIPNTTTKAGVINMSLGGSGACSNALQNAINGAYNRGTVIVVSAGNSKADAKNYNPANCANVITVAATGRNGGRASYSNFGDTVEIAAPGGSGSNYVWSTLNSGKTKPGADIYAGYQGTSMAAPHVAGVVALMQAKSPSITPAQVLQTLQSTARPFPAACSKCGAGIVDAAAAVAATP